MILNLPGRLSTACCLEAGGRIETCDKNADIYTGIQYRDIAYGTQYGFAAVATNNGHNGTSGGAFFHAPEVLKDFAGRALYTGVQVGKDIATQFYKRKPGKSYYIGCSTGGRQGWYAAQNYPDLFDGIISGAPVLAFSGQLVFTASTLTTLGNNTSVQWLDAVHWAAVGAEVMKQCDALDGAVDGILEDTRKCQLDLIPLLCSTDAGRKGCLNEAQAEVVKKVFSPFVVDGKVVHSGASHGYESAFFPTITSSTVEAWVYEWYAYVVYQG